MWNDEDVEVGLRKLRTLLHETRGLSRRAFLARLGQAAAAAPILGVLTGHVHRASADAQSIATMGWGGAWKDACQKAYFDPFTKKTGVPVKYVAPYEFGKVRAMHEAGRMEIDVLEPGSVDTPHALKLGMAQKLDWSVIDKSALTPNQFKYGDWAISSITLSTCLVYNKKKWPGDNYPRSWADFWDVKKFPGPRALQRRVYPNLEYALMADGVPADPKKLYPLDVDRAFRSLDRIKPHVTVWWTTGAQQQQLIQDQEVDLIAMWNGRATDSITNNGAPYQIVWNQAAYNGEIEGWIVMKGAPNPKMAMRFMDVVGRAEPQATFARALFYGPTNLKAYDFIEKKVAQELPSYPPNAQVSLLMNYDWWLDRIDPLTVQFERWLQS
ncbi:MAG TPA: ABC transporter substrate-binding protein [Candidatus Bathyarchaeia archaeon]|nr:ABC transporter substrate-binding protein [Candidatus Bathyarchaeia archaeon]